MLLATLLVVTSTAHATYWESVSEATVGYTPQKKTQQVSLARPIAVSLGVKKGGCYLIGLAVDSQDAWSERVRQRGLVWYAPSGPNTLEQYYDLAMLDLGCVQRPETIALTIEPARCGDTAFGDDCSGVPGKGLVTITIFEKLPPPPTPRKPRRAKTEQERMIQSLAALAPGPVTADVLGAGGDATNRTAPPHGRISLDELRERRERPSAQGSVPGSSGPRQDRP